MAEKIKKYGRRAALVGIEGLLVVAVLLVLALGALFWRLSAGPFDVSFARDYVEQSLYDPVTDSQVEVGSLVLSWPDIRKPLSLQLTDINILRGGASILSVDQVLMGLRGPLLLVGRVEPVSVTVKGPALRLIRTADNKIGLRAEKPDTIASAPEESDTAQNPLQQIVTMLGKAETKGFLGRRSPLASLRTLEIEEARLILEDHVLGITWYMRDLDLLFARDRKGLIFTASAALPGGRVGPGRFELEAVHFRDNSHTRLSLALHDFDPRILAHKVEALAPLADHEIFLNGTLEAELDPALQLLQARLSASAKDGSLLLAEQYDAPLPYQEMALDVSYDRAAGLIDLSRLSLKAQEVGVLIASKISLTKTGIIAPVTVAIDDLPHAAVKKFWPRSLEDSSARTWVVERLSGGLIQDMLASFTIKADKTQEGWSTSADSIVASFRLSDMAVDYEAPLTPASALSGVGRFEGDVLTIDIEKAAIGALQVANGQVRIDKIGLDEMGTVVIKAPLTGPLPAVFAYIANEPISMTGAELGLDTKGVRGQAQLDIGVNFPTDDDLKKEDVKVTVEGTLTDTVLPDVVKTLDLTGGPLALSVKDGQVSLSGKAMLEGRNIDLTWQQYIDSAGRPFSSKVDASLITDRDLRNSLGVTIDEWIEESLPAKVTYTSYAGGRAEVDVTADLKSAKLKVAPFDFEKPIGVNGTLTCKAILKDGDLQEINKLAVQTEGLSVKDGRLLFKTRGESTDFNRGEIPRLLLGNTDARLDLEQETPTSPMKIGVKGAALDAQSFLDGRDKTKNKEPKPYDGPALLATVAVTRMYTKPDRWVDKAKIYLDMNREGLVDQLELDAVAGKGAVYLRLKPDKAGKMDFRLEADDAGAMLRIFGVYENVSGGKLVVAGAAGTPAQKRIIYGKAQISDFRVVNAPVLAQLVNAISPAGLTQLLNNEGIYFSRLESGFEWYMRPLGDLYVIKDGRTTGSSLGLTFEGTIDKDRNRTEISGHIVPLSEVNTLLSNIPLLGTILSGGDNSAIFAANYSINGPSESPTVSVNPLSVLTPGILRRILFENE